MSGIALIFIGLTSLDVVTELEAEKEILIEFDGSSGLQPIKLEGVTLNAPVATGFQLVVSPNPKRYESTLPVMFLTNPQSGLFSFSFL